MTKPVYLTLIASALLAAAFWMVLKEGSTDEIDTITAKRTAEETAPVRQGIPKQLKETSGLPSKSNPRRNLSGVEPLEKVEREITFLERERERKLLESEVEKKRMIFYRMHKARGVPYTEDGEDVNGARHDPVYLDAKYDYENAKTQLQEFKLAQPRF